jgi:Tfp pilus assembly protein PilF
LAGPEVGLKIGKQIVALGDVHRVYRVEKEQGHWLWINDGTVAGWVKQSDLVPFDRALEDATKAIEAGDRSADAYVRRGLLLADRGRTDLAIADYEEATRIQPNYATAFLNLGIAHRFRGEIKAAQENLDEAVRLSLLDGSNYYNRALLRLSQKDLQGALGDLNRTLDLSPSNAAAWFNHGAVMLIMDKPMQASIDTRVYLELAGWKESLSSYAALIAWAGATRAGNDEVAGDLILRALVHCDKKRFQYKILQYVGGKIELETLLAEAPSEDEAAEARLYAAIALDSTNHVEQATELYQWVVQHSDPNKIPYLVAESTLKSRGHR